MAICRAIQLAQRKAVERNFTNDADPSGRCHSGEPTNAWLTMGPAYLEVEVPTEVWHVGPMIWYDDQIMGCIETI